MFARPRRFGNKKNNGSHITDQIAIALAALKKSKFRCRFKLSERDRQYIQNKLVQKYYGYEQQKGEFTGIYFWDSEQSMQEFQQTEPARTDPVA